MKYIKFLAPFILFLLSSFCYSQKEGVSKLLHILPSLKDSVRINCLNSLSAEYVMLEKKDSAKYYANLAYEESKRINYIHGIAVSFVQKARIVKHFDDNFIESEKLARQSLKWFDKTPNKTGLYDAYFELSYSTHSQSRFAEAIQFVIKEYELSKNDGNNENMNDALGGLGAIYKDAGNYERSFYYDQQCLGFALKLKNKYRVQCALFELGELYMKIEDYTSALENYQQAFEMDNRNFEKQRKDGDWDIWIKMEYAEIFSHLNQFDSAWHYFELFKPASKNDRYYRVYLVSIGEYYFLKKEYTKALNNFLPGLYWHKKLNDRNEIQRTLIFVAKTYLALQQYDSAMRYGKEALAVANSTKAKQIIRDACQVIYSVYDWKKQPDSANKYFRQYSIVKDSVASDQVKAKFAVSTFVKQIELLDKEKLSQQQLLHQTTQQKKLLIVSIIAFFITGSIIFRNILLKRKNESHLREKVQKELEVHKLETERTKAELQQQAAELEMQALRAQMNPHFIFNSLNSINLFILQNNKTMASEYLTKFSRLVRLILQNSQLPIIPLESELSALNLYLELEVLRFDNHFDYKISVNKELDTMAIKVPPMLIQPFAENAIWHGLMQKEEKGNLEIELYEEESMLCCKITDDGIGRKKAAEFKSKSTTTHKSMGMQITASRIAMMKSNGQLTSQIKITDLILPDGRADGTEVLLKIPVNYD